ncbi:MarR family winged helix-turn-helix transcriptional regulator [Secundilactobacillus folii]|uniref:MarR family transcriptional regulator n=1 Tax=Secundilactobacillus folii TaxID=2678357 RepID=A0A7X3C229_9LACO|nr:MarR family transcriptional regulator [Secundilactobacillus folii]MTV81387.1 MarR family transcriptional regulator [Secundilactobacillus folii]
MVPDRNDNTMTKQLHVASNIATRTLEKRLKPFGVNGSQFFFILKLHDDPGITQDQLVRSDTLHQSNVNREIARLASMGLVDKRQSKTDGRKYELRLTADGEAMYPKIKAALDAQEEALSACIAAAPVQVSREDFMAVLRQIKLMG